MIGARGGGRGGWAEIKGHSLFYAYRGKLLVIMSSIFLGIVRLQKDLLLLTTKRSCSKSGVVNDRKVRDRVEGV